eukprot:3064189-Pleurochrysis_carterae.AAC.1
MSSRVPVQQIETRAGADAARTTSCRAARGEARARRHARSPEFHSHPPQSTLRHWTVRAGSATTR